VIVELKRCPWCNCHALSLEITELQYNISCFQCGCLGPRANTIQQAVRRWNGSVRDTEEGWTSLVVYATRRQVKQHNRNDLKKVEL
jgi:hypothetical protein